MKSIATTIDFHDNIKLSNDSANVYHLRLPSWRHRRLLVIPSPLCCFRNRLPVDIGRHIARKRLANLFTRLNGGGIARAHTHVNHAVSLRTWDLVASICVSRCVSGGRCPPTTWSIQPCRYVIKLSCGPLATTTLQRQHPAWQSHSQS